jgi:RHS repeat-associated protein
LPTILCEINPCDPGDPNGSLKNSYIYANGQILTQQVYNACAEPNEPNNLYFYIHDRLGSVRLVISDAADVNNSYTYSPSGEMFASECTETVYNPFLFTGQWWDPEIRQYYLRARMYDPRLGRFTSRDPVMGKFQEPLTLHAYLYCVNDPTNRIDPEGRLSALILADAILNGGVIYNQGINLATFAASTENWKFFDLAEVTMRYAPFAMGIAAATSLQTWPGRVAALIAGVTIEETTHITGLSVVEGAFLNPYVYQVYCLIMMTARFEFRVGVEMEDFLEWKAEKFWYGRLP